MQTAAHRLNETQSKEGVRQTQVMKSYPPENGPPDHSMKGHQNNQPEKLPIEDMEKNKNGESEKDSGYSDSSSESISSEETPRSSKGDEPKTSEGTTQAPTTYTPIYILQNVVLKQPRILLVQQPVRCHGKRPNPSSYLPILRSYPRIAPRLTTHPASSPKASPPDRIPSPTVRNPPKKSHKPPQLLDISLRSVALLHRTRETQRSIRELRAHTKLYQRALRGEEGGWERLRRAMERSGVYRGSKWSSAAKASSLAEEPIEEGKRPSVMAAVLLEEAIGSPMTDIDMEEDTVEGFKVDAV